MGRDSVAKLSEDAHAKDKEIADLKSHIDELEAARGSDDLPFDLKNADAIVEFILANVSTKIAKVVGAELVRCAGKSWKEPTMAAS